ncbi:ANTAR domain-containing protein [Streptomyces sp. NPDC002920]
MQHLIVTISGEWDITGAQRLRRVLEDAVDRCDQQVELDLSGVTFCDCSVLNALLDARLRALGQGKTLTVRAAGPFVRRLLATTETSQLFAGTPEDLRNEITQLRRAMRTRPAIDQARGVLMATFSLSAGDAWAVLVAVSQHTNTKLHHIAEELLTAVHGEALAETTQRHLAAAVSARREGGATSADRSSAGGRYPRLDC